MTGPFRSTTPTVSVIIPVYNNADTLGAVLDALDAQTYPNDRYQVIVVDNNATDGSADVVRAHPRVTLLFERAVQSSYAARNRGIGHADGELLAFLDGDCVADPDWILEGVRAMCAVDADLAGGVVEAEGGLLADYERISYFRQQYFIETHGTSAGGCLFLSRRLIEKIGPFRAGLVSGGDGEICLRARFAGFSITYAAGARVCHRATSGLLPLLSRYHRLGGGEAFLKEYGLHAIRDVDSGYVSRKVGYVRRVWQHKEISPLARLAIMSINLLASVMQVIGYIDGLRQLPRGGRGPWHRA